MDNTSNVYLTQDKLCTIYVQWLTDSKVTGSWGLPRNMDRQPQNVRFANGVDLRKQLERLSEPCRWRKVRISAPDMAPRIDSQEDGRVKEFEWSKTVYTDTAYPTYEDFPRIVDVYCNQWIDLKRRILNVDNKYAVTVKIDLHVVERGSEHWKEPVNSSQIHITPGNYT